MFLFRRNSCKSLTLILLRNSLYTSGALKVRHVRQLGQAGSVELSPSLKHSLQNDRLQA
jgi:hypothetical protein